MDAKHYEVKATHVVQGPSNVLLKSEVHHLGSLLRTELKLSGHISLQVNEKGAVNVAVEFADIRTQKVTVDGQELGASGSAQGKAQRLELDLDRPIEIGWKEDGNDNKIIITLHKGAGPGTAAAPAEAPMRVFDEARPRNMELAKVPVDEIFKAEADALGTAPDVRKAARERYESYVSGLVGCVLEEWPELGQNPESVQKISERDLFPFLTSAFLSNFDADFRSNELLTTSMQSNMFNCYSSAALMADVLTRLGKPVDIMLADYHGAGHVLVVGKEYSFETTAPDPRYAIQERAEMASRYQFLHERDPSGLLAIAYEWGAKKISDRYRDPARAVAFYDKALESNPESINALYNKGLDLETLHKPAEALACYDKAIGLYPAPSSDAMSQKRFLLEQMERYEKRLDQCDLSLGSNPSDAASWRGKGNALAHLGRSDEAVGCYDSALELEPKDAFTLNLKEEELALTGRFEDALECTDLLLEWNPADARALDRKGYALSHLGRLKEALEFYDRSLEINPKDERTWTNKGVALQDAGRYGDADQCFDKAGELTEQLLKPT